MLSRWLKRREPSFNPPDPWDLSAPLMRWSRDDAWSISDAVTGTLVCGATGSGKSSGSGRTIAGALLSAGFGGLVLTAKPDEKELWVSYCAAAGRSDDLIEFAPDQPWRFNFLDHELNRVSAGAGLTENIVDLFSTVLEVAQRGQGGAGREDEGYWQRALKQLLRNAVDLLTLAKGRITVPELYRIVVSAATSPEQLLLDSWRSTSLCFRCLAEADQRLKTPSQSEDYRLVADYFLLEYPALSDKTRTVIVSTFTSMADVLMRGVLRDLFAKDTNVTPEASLSGKILLINLPVKTFNQVGVFAQILWKHAWQRSMEQRSVAQNARPVFLWADEAQLFVTSQDAQVQTTCRSSRVATVLLTQNISNVYAALGSGEKGEATANSLFANLTTKIFHANGDSVTNEWAAKMIGQTRQFFVNAGRSEQDTQWGQSITGLGRGGNTSSGVSEQTDFDVPPSAFTTLRTGGRTNNWQVDGLVFQSGRRFKGTGRTWLRTTFEQQIGQAPAVKKLAK